MIVLVLAGSVLASAAIMGAVAILHPDAANVIGVTGASSQFVSTGPTGPTGPPGQVLLLFTGPTGPLGYVGPTGRSSLMIGATGHTGSAGFTGPQGVPGPIGSSNLNIVQLPAYLRNTAGFVVSTSNMSLCYGGISSDPASEFNPIFLLFSVTFSWNDMIPPSFDNIYLNCPGFPDIPDTFSCTMGLGVRSSMSCYGKPITVNIDKSPNFVMSYPSSIPGNQNFLTISDLSVGGVLLANTLFIQGFFPTVA